MLPYFLLLFFSIVFPLIIYHSSGTLPTDNYNILARKKNELTVKLFFLGFFILLALRDVSVGNDLIEYRRIFENCIQLPFDKLSNMRWEVGYTFYNKLIGFVSKDFRFLLIVTALITLVPIYKLYAKENRYQVLLILLFINMPCFPIVFSGLRQSIAMSIGILAYMAIENKKYISSVLMIVLACCFHISAFVLVLLYPMIFFKIKTKHLLYIVPIMVVVYVCRIPLLLLTFRFLPEQYLSAYGTIEETGAFGMLILFLLFSIFSFVVLDETVMAKKDYFMRNILLVATMFQFFVPIHGLVQRASYYFLLFVPVSIISVVQAPKKMWKSISDFAAVVIGCFFSLYFFYNASFSTDNLLNVFPYKFFWSGEGW